MGSIILRRLYVPAFDFVRTGELDLSSIQCTRGRGALLMHCYKLFPKWLLSCVAAHGNASRKWEHGGLAEAQVSTKGQNELVGPTIYNGGFLT